MLLAKVNKSAQKWLFNSSWWLKSQERWQNMQPRERLFLAVGVIAAFLLLIYVLLLNPFFDSSNALKRQVAHQQQLALWLQQATTQIEKLKNAGYDLPSSNYESLLVLINNNAQQHNLTSYINKISENDEGEVVIQFSTVPFDALIEWLTGLWRQYGVAVAQLNLTPQKTTGLVAVNLVLKK